MSDNSMQFVVDFLKYINEVGIYDEYDPDEQCMVTSDDIEEFILRAEALVPPRLGGMQSSKMMRELTPQERELLIASNDEKVIDMRGVFAAKMAENGSARGLLEKIVIACNAGDSEEAARLYKIAEKFVTEDFNEE